MLPVLSVTLVFQVWMCGGSLEIHPCSLVGHVFRDYIPYDFGKTAVFDTLKKNAVRLASVWLDDYNKYYFEEIGNKLVGEYRSSSMVKLDNCAISSSFENIKVLLKFPC